MNATYDDAMYGFAEQWVTSVQDISTAHGTADPFLYLNFAAQWQDPICSYGEESVAFLKQVAQAYDPDGIFQTLAPGGFKLSKACA
jgi:hypothetical protein